MSGKRNGRPARKQVRLLKVMVQPIFVIEDGDDREEMAGGDPNGGPLIVSGKDWPNFAAQLEDQRKTTEKQLNEAS